MILYNRPKSLNILLNNIKKYNFNKIYFISDGPKNNKDIKLVNECRKIIKKLRIYKIQQFRTYD